jgi:hypothetical protein
MADDDDRMTGSTCTGDRCTNARAILTRAHETPGKIKEIDERRAALQKGVQARITQYTNVELIAQAQRLNNRLFQSDEDVGVLEKAAIAETLIKMHQEMDNRIQEAAVKQIKFPPALVGVNWKENDPLTGIVEGISPFHMIDWWGAFLSQPSTESRRKPRPQPTPKQKKPDQPEKEAQPKQPSPKSTPKRKPTLKEAIDRARKAVGNMGKYKIADLGPQLRLYCILSKIENPSADAWYINGSAAKGLVKRYAEMLELARTKIENNTLTSNEKSILNKVDPAWEKEISSSSKTKYQRIQYAYSLARHLADPIFKQYWDRQDRGWSKDARQEIIRIIEERQDKDEDILRGLRLINLAISELLSWRTRLINTHHESGKAIGYAEKLILERIDKLRKDRNSVLYCFTIY